MDKFKQARDFAKQNGWEVVMIVNEDIVFKKSESDFTIFSRTKTGFVGGKHGFVTADAAYRFLQIEQFKSDLVRADFIRYDNEHLIRNFSIGGGTLTALWDVDDEEYTLTVHFESISASIEHKDVGLWEISTTEEGVKQTFLIQCLVLKPEGANL